MWLLVALFALAYGGVLGGCYALSRVPIFAPIAWSFFLVFHVWSVFTAFRHRAHRFLMVVHEQKRFFLELQQQSAATDGDVSQQIEAQLRARATSLRAGRIVGVQTPDGGPVYPLWLLAHSPSVFPGHAAHIVCQGGERRNDIYDDSCAPLSIAPDTYSWDALCGNVAAGDAAAKDAECARLHVALAAQMRRRGFALIRVPSEVRASIDALWALGDEAFQRLSRADKARHSRRAHDCESTDLGFHREATREYYEHRHVVDRAAAGEFVAPSAAFARAAADAFERLNTIAIMLYSLLCEHVPELNSAAALELLDEECVDMRARPRVSSSCFRLHAYYPRSAAAAERVGGCMCACACGDCCSGARTDEHDNSAGDDAVAVTQAPHADLGLLTVAPRGSCVGLQIIPLDGDHGDNVDSSGGDADTRPLHAQRGGARWVNIEERMHADDLIVFAASTLAWVTRDHYRPVLHRAVRLTDQTRLSMPFFLRANPRALLAHTRLYASADAAASTSVATTTTSPVMASAEVADFVPLLHDTGTATLRASSSVSASHSMSAATATSITTVHDLMANLRLARNGARIPVAWMRWVYEYVQPVIARRWPHLERAISPSGRV